jgi:hypothetical protein
MRPDTNKIFYVGKGNGNRLNSHKYRNRHWHFIVNKNNGNFIPMMLHKCDNEQQALNLERRYIKIFRVLFGKKYLTNISDGGIGGKTTEVVWNKGKKTSEENKLKLRKPRSAQAKLNIRNARLLQFQDPTKHPRWLGFIKTPKGIFRTQSEAAIANSVSQSHLHKLVNENNKDYYYIEDFQERRDEKEK